MVFKASWNLDEGSGPIASLQASRAAEKLVVEVSPQGQGDDQESMEMGASGFQLVRRDRDFSSTVLYARRMRCTGNKGRRLEFNRQEKPVCGGCYAAEVSITLDGTRQGMT